jgi:uncharacterized membrane protein YfcA
MTNIFKLPFHIWVWRTIQSNSLYVDLILLPALLIGLFAGIKLVKAINQNQFRVLIIILTGLGAILILLKS